MNPQGERNSQKVYAATEARAKFSNIFDEAYFGKRVVVEKRDRRVAVVSIAFLELADRLIQKEAEKEALEANRALKEFQAKGGKTLEQLEAELDMD